MNKLFLNIIKRYSSLCPPPKPPPCAPSRLPRYDSLKGPSGTHPTPEGGYKKYTRLWFFICLPLIVFLSVTVLGGEHCIERPPFRKYPYLRKRDKLFPWEGGTEKSFFHNPEVNALPNGYEDGDNDNDNE